jgi:hypothetical protein
MSEQFGNQTKSYSNLLVRAAYNNFKAFAYEQIAIDGSIKKLNIPDGAKYALLTVESDVDGIVVRYLETLSETVAVGYGIPVTNGSAFDVTDYENLVNFQITEESSNTTMLNVQYYK